MTHNELRKYLVDHYPESTLQLITDERKAALIAKYPELPSDYVQFLCEVGFGAIGDARYSVYGEPVAPSLIFDHVTAVGLRDVVLIGDDFAGGQEAFQFRNEGTIFGSVDSLSGRFEPDADGTFSKFIERWFIE